MSLHDQLAEDLVALAADGDGVFEPATYKGAPVMAIVVLEESAESIMMLGEREDTEGTAFLLKSQVPAPAVDDRLVYGPDTFQVKSILKQAPTFAVVRIKQTTRLNLEALDHAR